MKNVRISLILWEKNNILASVRQQSDSKLLHTRTDDLFQLYGLNNKASDCEFGLQQGIMLTEMKSSCFISSKREKKMDGKSEENYLWSTRIDMCII